MKPTTVSSIITGSIMAIGVLAGALMFGSARPASGNTPAPLKIAVVDMTAALKNCKILEELSNRARQNLESDWKEEIERVEAEAKLVEERFKERSVDETATNRELEDLREEMEIKKAQMKLAREARSASADVMRFRNTLETIAAANIVIRDYANRMGFDLVLKQVTVKNNLNDSSGSDASNSLAAQQAFRQSAQENIVLYFRGGHNIPKNGEERIMDISQIINDILTTANYDEYEEKIKREIGIK